MLRGHSRMAMRYATSTGDAYRTATKADGGLGAPGRFARANYSVEVLN